MSAKRGGGYVNPPLLSFASLLSLLFLLFFLSLLSLLFLLSISFTHFFCMINSLNLKNKSFLWADFHFPSIQWHALTLEVSQWERLTADSSANHRPRLGASRPIRGQGKANNELWHESIPFNNGFWMDLYTALQFTLLASCIDSQKYPHKACKLISY